MHRHKTIITRLTESSLDPDEKGCDKHDEKIERFLYSIKGSEVIQMTTFALNIGATYSAKICTTIEYETGDELVVTKE